MEPQNLIEVYFYWEGYSSDYSESLYFLEEDWNELNLEELIGQEVDLGERDGKHSCCEGTLEKEIIKPENQFDYNYYLHNDEGCIFNHIKYYMDYSEEKINAIKKALISAEKYIKSIKGTLTLKGTKEELEKIKKVIEITNLDIQY